MENKFVDSLNDILKFKKHNSTYLSERKYDDLLVHLKELKESKKTKTPNDYKLIKKYDILKVRDVERLVVPTNGGDRIRFYVKNEELFHILHEAHLSIGHGGRSRMEHVLNSKYKNITRETIMLYLGSCEFCQKKSSTSKNRLEVKHSAPEEKNSRCCEIGVIDMQTQPDGNYKFILVYQDHLTKFVNLRPLTHQRAHGEVACALLDIFTIFGAPTILQSDNGGKFANEVIEELWNTWKDLKMILKKPRHSQSQGSVEHDSQEVKLMLGTWLQNNKTKKWSEGLKLVQLMKNRSFHRGIKCSPYEAMFVSKPKI
ncbi:KRAB-A domain-containing protein 2-like [Sipha flava]|jgi:virulence-associated protein VapD|uniref:KRAB-A domain-containing protein 2 n=1 Tax=Sipha flava TaxID=143950 RepID=A0A2S2Q363_9HEMI|nr:KRAB-A domain-containing protein 2-like [Sipha flava]